MQIIFIHGLDSSSKGTKATWFRDHFPEIVIPDFTGSLEERMEKLDSVIAGKNELVMIGSSFGGLMATLFVQQNASRVTRLILLAPALNFPGFQGQADQKMRMPVHIYIGRQDTVCPPDLVVARAEQIFADLDVHLSEDDHLLRNTFPRIPWQELLSG